MGVGAVLYEERAQATVEMAVVTPVLLALALIVYNVMVFAGAVARFDRVVPDIVLAHAVAPEGEGDKSSADARCVSSPRFRRLCRAIICRSRSRASRARRRLTAACSLCPGRLGPMPASCTMSRG